MVYDIKNPAASEGQRPVILVVDDDPNNLAVVRDCLVEFKYTVLVAEDGESAIQRADYARPDLILLDIMMPGLDGIETCRRLKAMQSTKEIPVIFMTALAETEHKVKGLKAGAVDYITKPFHREELQSRIAVHLHNRELTKRLQEAKELLEARVEERTAELAATNEELQAEISERKQAEDELKQNINRQKAILNNIPDIAWLKDGESKFIAINEALENAMGFKNADVVGRTDLDFFPLDLAEHYRIDDMEVMKSGKRKQVEEYFSDKEGRIVWLETIKTPIFNEQEEVIGTTGIARDITKRKQTERALQQSEKKYKNLVETANDAVIGMTRSGTVNLWNKKAEAMFGYSADEAIGKDLHQLIVPEKYHDAAYAGLKVFARTGKGAIIGMARELTALRRDGTEFPAELSVSAMEIDGEWSALGIVRDITARKAAQEEMQKLSTSVEQSTESFVITDTAGKIEYVNKATQQITGYSRDELVDNNISIFKSVLQDKNVFQRLWSTISAGDSFTDILINRKKNGDIYFLHVVIGPLKDSQGKIVKFIATGRDITQQKVAEQQLNYLVYNDPLTGISNRNFYTERLEREIARVARDGRFVAAVVIDIDRFTFINDSRGPAFGDKVLRTVAERLSESIRKGDILARLGNDEFGLILVDIRHSEDIIYVFDKIMNKVLLPVEEELRLTVSGGVAIYPNDGESVEDLLMNADIALLKAKKEGGNNIQFVAPEMTIKVYEFARMEKQLVKAFREEEFVMYYQPYWDIGSKTVIGMEALIRWQSKDLGLVPPGRFIPILEETGLIIDVGKWVMKNCCLQVKEWLSKGYQAMPVSVNLSTIQFRQKDLLETITKAIDESGLDPHWITMEITESAIMEDSENANSVLQKLKRHGISISIDDFGTGYSSLSYLRRLPIDNLKIDISFIRDLAEDPDAASIVTTIIGMAHSLGLKTIAEGIETEEQWKILRLLRCNIGQGFYLSKPQPAADIEKFLVSRCFA